MAQMFLNNFVRQRRTVEILGFWEIGDWKSPEGQAWKLASLHSRREAPRVETELFSREAWGRFPVSLFSDLRMSITTRYNHKSVRFTILLHCYFHDFFTSTFSRFFKISRQRWELTSLHLWSVSNVRTGQSSPLAWIETAKSIFHNLLVKFPLPSSNDSAWKQNNAHAAMVGQDAKPLEALLNIDIIFILVLE